MAKKKKKDDKKGKRKTFKKKEKRTLLSGVAHIQATFNNTHVTVADADGQRGGVGERRRAWASRAPARELRSPPNRPPAK